MLIQFVSRQNSEVIRDNYFCPTEKNNQQYGGGNIITRRCYIISIALDT
jgi:hypothetical protein